MTKRYIAWSFQACNYEAFFSTSILSRGISVCFCNYVFWFVGLYTRSSSFALKKQKFFYIKWAANRNWIETDFKIIEVELKLHKWSSSFFREFTDVRCNYIVDCFSFFKIIFISSWHTKMLVEFKHFDDVLNLSRICKPFKQNVDAYKNFFCDNYANFANYETEENLSKHHMATANNLIRRIFFTSYWKFVGFWFLCRGIELFVDLRIFYLLYTRS